MLRILAIGLFLVAGQPGTQAGGGTTPWSSNKRALACTPKVLRHPGALLLTLGPGHGKELAIRRVAGDRWYFLVSRSPQGNEPQLMDSDAFEKATLVEIPTSIKARASADQPLEPVFLRSGVYEVYVSDALETEEGGYTCRFHYERRR